MTDIILRPVPNGSNATDVYLYKAGFSVTITDNLDVLFKKLGIPRTYTLDLMLKKVGVTSVYYLDVSLKKLDLTEQDSVDVLFKKLNIPKSTTLDILFQKVGVKASDTIDVLFKKLNLQPHYLLDVILLQLIHIGASSETIETPIKIQYIDRDYEFQVEPLNLAVKKGYSFKYAQFIPVIEVKMPKIKPKKAS